MGQRPLSQGLANSIMKRTLLLLGLATLTAAGPAALRAAEDQKDFRPLFNGKDVAGWKPRNQ